MNNRILIYLALLFFLGSCKKEFFQRSISDRNKLNIEELEFEYFQAKSKIKYNDGIQKVNASATIRIRKDSIIWISLSPSVGVELIRAIINKDSILVIDRFNKEYRQFGFDSLRRKFNIHIDYNMLQSALLGNLINERNKGDKVIKEDEYFILKQNQDNLAVNNFINSNTMKIERVEISDEPNSSSMEIRYDDFQLYNDMLLPNKNSFHLSYDQGSSELVSQININYNRISIDNKKMKFPFNIPNKYVPKE